MCTAGWGVGAGRGREPFVGNGLFGMRMGFSEFGTTELDATKKGDL